VKKEKTEKKEKRVKEEKGSEKESKKRKSSVKETEKGAAGKKKKPKKDKNAPKGKLRSDRKLLWLLLFVNVCFHSSAATYRSTGILHVFRQGRAQQGTYYSPIIDDCFECSASSFSSCAMLLTYSCSCACPRTYCRFWPSSPLWR
jgi:hypothetical protein